MKCAACGVRRVYPLPKAKALGLCVECFHRFEATAPPPPPKPEPKR